MNTFRFVGKIKKLEDKKDRKFIDTIDCKDGWEMTKVKFRVAADDCSEFLEVAAGKYKDDSRNTVYTQFIKEGSENKRDTENVKVNWNERFNPDTTSKVPDYKKYTIDLASDKARDALIKEGKNDEAAALAEKKYVYISAYDFTQKIKELLINGGFGDEKYVITGTVEYTYSANKASYYRSFVPTNIYKASADEAMGCSGKFDFYYNKEELGGDESEDGSLPLSGYVQYYDRMSKEYFYAPTTLTVKSDFENKQGLLNTLKLLGGDDAEVFVIGLNVKFFSGSQKVELNEDDLTDDQKALIAWGMKTKEEIIADMGGSAYGDRVNMIYVEKLSRGYANGPQKTEVTLGDIARVPSGKKGDTVKVSPKKIDIFADDDEI